jgi:predicted O-methyltransferase YrrM
VAEVKHRELFGPNHFDEAYYESITRFLEGLDPLPKRGLEVGFCWGMSARAFLELTEPVNGALLSLDKDDQMGKANDFKKYGKRFELKFGDSSTIMKSSKGKQVFDWIYIDGDHAYEGVKKDLLAALPLLAEDGVMFCDDYGNPCGVKQAVDELVIEYHLNMQPVPLSPSRAVVLRRA